MRRVTLLAAFLVLTLPGVARGATLSVFSADSCQGDSACAKYGAGQPVPVVSFTGQPGEANRVTVRRDGAAVTVHDAGAPVRAAEPCRAVDERTARCPAAAGEGSIPGFAASLGDGDDRIEIVSGLQARTSLSGGPGADHLAGGPDEDRLDGGAGPDAMVGGPGDDVVDYAGHAGPVLVALAPGTGGELGERDTVAGVEAVVGTPRADSLAGGEGADALDGGFGNDRLNGRAGADVLLGDRGADVLSGGPGDDRLEGDPEQGDDVYTDVFRPGRDVLRGGSGDDLLVDPTGGGDRLSGGSGDDRLSVDGPGGALLLGGSGNDALTGGAARDTFRAGGGRDRVDARDDTRERVDCGRGRDRVSAGRRDRLRRCERRRG